MRYIFTFIAGIIAAVYGMFYAASHIRPVRVALTNVAVTKLEKMIFDDRYPEGRYRPRNYTPYRPFRGPMPLPVIHRLIYADVDTHEETVKLSSDLSELIEEFGWFTIADLKTALGISPNFQDNLYGWNTTDGVLWFAKDSESNKWNFRTLKPAQEINATSRP